MNVLLVNKPCEISSENGVRFEYQAKNEFFPVRLVEGVECLTKATNTTQCGTGFPPSLTQLMTTTIFDVRLPACSTRLCSREIEAGVKATRTVMKKWHH